MTHEKTVTVIIKETGISKEELLRHIARCLSTDPTGQVWGYRALIPGKHIASYSRQSDVTVSTIDTTGKLNGAFELLLDSHPSIRERIETLYLRRDKGKVRESVMSVAVLHKHFLDACRSEGLKITDYPFNTKNLGRRALYRYIKSLEAQNFSEAAKRSGEEANRHARTTGYGEKNNPMLIRPFERVQFDGHRIDAMIAVKSRTPYLGLPKSSPFRVLCTQIEVASLQA